ncbi:MAG TPA: hypothetical protein VKA50_06365 [Gammaproteobacteria bacterium]|nr:hypothetical protein [Gammaproteobacteria bacterium]
MRDMKRQAVFAALSIGLAAAGVLPGAAHADVTVTRETHFGGFMGMGANDTTSKEYIHSDKKRDESTMKFTGSILSKIGGTHSSVKIYRVDKNEIIELKPASRTYTVLPMTVKNAQRASSPNAQSGQGAQSQSGNADKSREHTRVIRNDLSVKATGKHKTINGYKCREYVMTWVVVTEDTQTKQRSKSVMTSDLWTTPRTHALRVLAADEAAYNHAYLKRLGLDLSPQQQHQFGLGMLGLMSGKSQKDLKRAMSKIHGYPISTTVKWQSNAKAETSEGADSSGNGEQALKQVAGNLGSMLGSVFHHNEAAKKPDKPANSDMKTVFRSTTNIVSVRTGTVPASLFAVPAGYKRARY